MKNNKKGFTLIELLAVIAILAILVVIAVPAVLDLFNSSKESAFRTQAQTLLKAVEQQIVSDTIDPSITTPNSKYSNVVTGTGISQLTLSGGTSVNYYFEIDTEAEPGEPNITCMIMYNDATAIIKSNPTVASLSDVTLTAASTYNTPAPTTASLATACTTAP